MIEIFRKRCGYPLANHGLYEAILACINEPVYVADLQKNILFMNKKAELITGWAADEALKTKKCFQVFGDREGGCADNCPVEFLLKKGTAGNNLEKTIISRSGNKLYLKLFVSPLPGQHKISGAIVILEEQLQIQKALVESEEKYRHLLESIEDGFYEVDLAGSLRYCNEALLRIYGMVDKKSVKGTNYRHYMDKENAEKVYEAYNRVFNTGLPEKGFNMEIKRPEGTARTLEASISLVRDYDGNPTGFRGIVRDITERRQSEERLKYLSMHDVMTGLYNRTYFEEEMARLNGGRFSPVTIICCDVDGLKMVNDTFGHKKGDELLKTVAEILKAPFRSSDVVARVGGDEFAIILPKTDEVAARRTCERISQAVGSHILSGTGTPISLSIGSATGIISKELSCDELYRRADNNMYRSKLQSKANSRGAVVGSLVKTLAERDFMTAGHAPRAFQYANQLGTASGLSKRELADLKLLAEFHDIGKAGVPEAILFKREPLTLEEWEEIRQHSEIGYRIAKSTPELSFIADWILYHHEWWNGQGYPLGLKGQEIPLLCRVFSVAEAFEVLTCGRPYRRAMDIEEALKELKKCSGTQFDPDLVDLFLNIATEYR